MYLYGDDPITYLHALAVVAVVLSAGWIVATLAFRLAPRAATQFAIANLLLVVGVMLESRRGEANAYLTYQCADLCELTALTLLRGGVQRLQRLTFTWEEHVVVLVLATGLLFNIPPKVDSTGLMVAVFGLSVAWITLRLFVEAARSLRHTIGLRAAVAILWPAPAFGLVQIGRTIWFALHPFATGISSDITVQTKSNILLLLFTCILLLTANMALVGLVIGRMIARTQDLARRDTLTGVLNRRALNERLEAEHERLRRGGRGFVLAMFDLDHFKRINDTLGHAGGDAALRHAAQKIGGQMRAMDTLARFGGEEFVVIFAMTDLPIALNACERLRAYLESSPFLWGENPVTVTVSIGVAGCTDPAEGIESVLRRADLGVYAAKENGRNRVQAGPPHESADLAPAQRVA